MISLICAGGMRILIRSCRSPRSNDRVGLVRSILGAGTSTSQSGLPNRFKIDSHDLGQNQVSAPGDDVEAQGPEIERSSGSG